MNHELASFNPSEWLDGPVVVAGVRRLTKLAKRAKATLVAASIAVSASATWASPALAYHADSTSSVRAPGLPAAAEEFGPGTDYEVDPAHWGNLIQLFGRLPRSEEGEIGDEPEPAI